MSAAKVSVAGHFGELLQGRLGASGPLALITLPCPALLAHATAAGTADSRTPRHFTLHQQGACALTHTEAARFLRALDLPLQGRFTLRLDMPPGGGAGASTAARVALARAAGEYDPARIAHACRITEGASDPLMLPRPERLLWASREGRILAALPPLPRLQVLGGFFGPGQRTDPLDLNFPDISDLVARWPAACAAGAAAVAGLASLSATRTLAQRGPHPDPTAALAARHGALGWAIAHTGAARALLFAPGMIPEGATADLRRAGFSRITAFRIGGD
jgi:uncharacterized protein involved in propanediol utilization